MIALTNSGFQNERSLNKREPILSLMIAFLCISYQGLGAQVLNSKANRHESYSRLLLPEHELGNHSGSIINTPVVVSKVSPSESANKSLEKSQSDALQSTGDFFGVDAEENKWQSQEDEFVTLGDVLNNNSTSEHPEKPTSDSSNPSSHDPRAENSNEKHNAFEMNEAYVVFFVIVSLGIGAICLEIKKISGLPYTPMLLVAGMFMGIFSQSLMHLGINVNLVLEINPHGILLIFIPILIFESAFNIDPFVLKNELWQILLLAGPGVIIGSLILGFFFNGVLMYSNEIAWSGAFTLASIICATDPVAVVALLKEVGAPAKFNVLLEGESLLNDGTAMVFYIIFSSIYKDVGVSLPEIVFKFLQLTLGGVVCGTVGCFLALFWIRRIIKHHLLTVNLILLSCYLTFFVSEFYFGASGIIAIVTLGMLMGNFGKFSINPESLEWNHLILTYLQFALETVLFIITGCYIGKHFLLDVHLNTITNSDILRVVLFFVLMNVGRFIMILLLKPSINYLGWPITVKDTILLTYAGLRGSIALCLALMVAVDEDYSDRFRHLVLFYVICMITFTVLLNGLSINFVMRRLGLNEKSVIKKRLKRQLKQKLIVEAMMNKTKIVDNKFLRLTNWNSVLELSGVKKEAEKIRKSTKEKSSVFGSQRSLIEATLLCEESVYETRLRVYQQIKANVWHNYEEALCSSSAAKKLGEVIDLCIEDLSVPISIWKVLSVHFIDFTRIQTLMQWKEKFLIGYFAKRILVSRLLESYEMLFGLLISLQGLLETRSDLPIQSSQILQIFNEVSQNAKHCEEYLFNFINLFPDLAIFIQDRYAAKILINKQREALKEIYKSGAIPESDFGKLSGKLLKLLKNLEMKNISWELAPVHPLKLVCPVLSSIKHSSFERLAEAAVVQSFKKDQLMLMKDKPSQVLFIVKSGVCRQDNSFQKILGGPGSIYSFANLLNPDCLSLESVYAAENVEAYCISNGALLKLISEDAEFEELAYKRAFTDIAKNCGLIKKTFPQIDISNLIESSTLLTLEKGADLKLEAGGYIFSGCIREFVKDLDSGEYQKDFRGQTLVLPSDTFFRAVQTSKLIKFSRLAVDGEEDSLHNFVLRDQRESYVGLYQKGMQEETFYDLLEKKILRP